MSRPIKASGDVELFIILSLWWLDTGTVSVLPPLLIILQSLVWIRENLKMETGNLLDVVICAMELMGMCRHLATPGCPQNDFNCMCWLGWWWTLFRRFYALGNSYLKWRREVGSLLIFWQSKNIYITLSLTWCDINKWAFIWYRIQMESR